MNQKQAENEMKYVFVEVGYVETVVLIERK